MGAGNVNDALHMAATAGRFADGNLLSILTFHGATGTGMVIADTTHALQQGTSGWTGFTTSGPAS